MIVVSTLSAVMNIVISYCPTLSSHLQRSTRLMKIWKSRGTAGRRPVTGSRWAGEEAGSGEEGEEESGA